MHRFLLIPVGALAGALALGCDDQPDVVAPAAEFARVSGQSVSGHIERDFTELGVPVEKFSFHAHYLGNGVVEGRWQLRDVFADGSREVASGSVTCFTVEDDGRTARIGGITERATNPANVGGDAFWTVVDNGEGANAPPDQATDLRFGQAPGGTAAHCEFGIPLEDFGTFGENVRANVQVRP
jgi:hypothetical protein